jgi:hypothetical protein
MDPRVSESPGYADLNPRSGNRRYGRAFRCRMDFANMIFPSNSVCGR